MERNGLLSLKVSESMPSLRLSVPELGCDGCEDIVEGALDDTAGVVDASADHQAGRVVLEGEGFSTDAVLETIEFAGYDATVEDGNEVEE